MNNISNEGLAKLADDLKKMTPPRYCAEHKPCDAKEHDEGRKVAMGIFVFIFGSLAWGCVLMFAVNAILADWLGVVDTLSYWQAIVGTAGLYALGEIKKGIM